MNLYLVKLISKGIGILFVTFASFFGYEESSYVVSNTNKNKSLDVITEIVPYETETKYNDQVTMQAFGFSQSVQALNKLTKNKNSMELESGIEGMTKLALSSRLTPEVVPNYTRMVFKDRLEILAA